MGILHGRAVIAGCARSCQPFLPAVLENVSRIAGLFSDSAFVFVENDSRDSSKFLLEAFARGRPNAHLLSLDGLADRQRVRTLRIAEARNTYLEKAKRLFPHYDWLIVLDLDNVNAAPLDTEALARSLEFLASSPDRAAGFANSQGAYYDLWALRHPRICPDDVWEQVLDLVVKQGLSDAAACDQVMKGRIFSIDPGTLPIEVDSAFGGLGLYKMDFVLKAGGRYIGERPKMATLPNRNGPGWTTTHHMQRCEHVSFHRAIRAIGGRLFIFPELINHLRPDPTRVRFAPDIYRRLVF